MLILLVFIVNGSKSLCLVAVGLHPTCLHDLCFLSVKTDPRNNPESATEVSVV